MSVAKVSEISATSAAELRNAIQQGPPVRQNAAEFPWRVFKSSTFGVPRDHEYQCT